MNISLIVFAAMAVVTIIFSAAMMTQVVKFQLPKRMQIGDTSFSRHSVDWLGTTALISAILICLL